MSQVTCGGCAATWSGASRAHCSGCHRTFSGLSLFDQHRRRSLCADPAELLDRGEPLRLLEGVWHGREASEIERARLYR
jgi:hypothetical protein